ncbi:LysR family transcriptional regulator [Shewanella sp. C32]|uniref:LysR family transcriptional regulator n=1 Tax=Shewanella electrica TaxID=515560 RepID=A0ABT2FNR4_9GAMM|nr:LysR family transcriptional regulator [Shewanella electrica]MCH1925850.1 LysR family transcriptional regulator [Shewanella electrica]MCS4557265.1 LysR family transcriptional regulator [Shewanella electrica]
MDATHLYRMLVFANVVEQGSLTGAAQQLGISRSMVSQHLKTLETKLQQQLLQRTTRSLALTAAGKDYYEHCAELTRMAKQAAAAITVSNEQLYGSIRLSVPEAWGTLKLLPQLGKFHRQHPQLQLNLSLEQADYMSITAWQADVAIIASSHAIQQEALPFAHYQQLIVASAEYVEQHGKPLHPDNLQQFHWLAASVNQLPQSWQLHDSSGQRYEVRLTPFSGCNSLLALKSLVEQSVGFACLPDYLCREALDQRLLVQLLPSYPLMTSQLFVVHRFGENIPPRVRVLLKFFQENFAD